MVWTLTDRVPALLWRVYSLVQERETQINSGDAMWCKFTRDTQRVRELEKLLREGDTWDLSAFEDVGEEERKMMVGESVSGLSD